MGPQVRVDGVLDLPVGGDRHGHRSRDGWQIIAALFSVGSFWARPLRIAHEATAPLCAVVAVSFVMISAPLIVIVPRTGKVVLALWPGSWWW